MTDLNKVAKILFQADAEYASCKRNKNGRLNHPAHGKIGDKFRKELVAIGEDEHSARMMLHEICLKHWRI